MPLKKPNSEAVQNHVCCEQKFDRLLTEMKEIKDKLADLEEKKGTKASRNKTVTEDLFEH